MMHVTLMKSITHAIKTHRFLRFAVILLAAGLGFIICMYGATLFTLSRTVPKIHQKYVAAFSGLQAQSSLYLETMDGTGCHNEAKFTVHIACDREYSLDIEASGNQTDDVQRMRNLFDQLIADGWTGGSKPNMYDVVPATKSGNLQLDGNGILYVSAWKSSGIGVACDINIFYAPVLPHIQSEHDSYDYQLYCRRSMIPQCTNLCD